MSARGLGKIFPNKPIKAREVPHFIHENIEDLEQIKNFFSPVCPLEKAGLNISMNDMGQIVVEPEYFYRAEYQGREVFYYGNCFCSGEVLVRFPWKRVFLKSIVKSRSLMSLRASFYYCRKLKAYIIKIDRRLKCPLVSLKVNTVARRKKWEVQLAYVSEFGEEAFQRLKKPSIVTAHMPSLKRVSYFLKIKV